MESIVPAVAFGVLALAIMAVAGALFVINRDLLTRNERLRELIESIPEPVQNVDEGRMRDLEDMVQRLPARWEDIKREAENDRAESKRLRDRATYAVRRSKEKLEELGLGDDGLDGMAEELGIRDDPGSQDQGVLQLHESLAPDGRDGQPIHWRDRINQMIRGG